MKLLIFFVGYCIFGPFGIVAFSLGFLFVPYYPVKLLIAQFKELVERRGYIHRVNHAVEFSESSGFEQYEKIHKLRDFEIAVFGNDHPCRLFFLQIILLDLAPGVFIQIVQLDFKPCLRIVHAVGLCHKSYGRGRTSEQAGQIRGKLYLLVRRERGKELDCIAVALNHCRRE